MRKWQTKSWSNIETGGVQEEYLLFFNGFMVAGGRSIKEQKKGHEWKEKLFRLCLAWKIIHLKKWENFSYFWCLFLSSIEFNQK